MNARVRERITRVTDRVVCLLGVAAIVYPWFTSPGYLFFTDFAWGPRTAPDWVRAPLVADAFLASFGAMMPHDLAEKLFILGALALIYIGGRRVVASLTDDSMLASVLGLFFLFNPFVYDRMGYGQIYLLAAFGFLCLGFAELLRVRAHGDERKRLPLAGLYAGLAIDLTPHFLFFAAVLGAAWLAARIARDRAAAGGPGWRGTLKALAVPSGIALAALAAVNAHWLVGGSTLFEAATVAGIGPADFDAFATAGRNAAEAWGNVLMFSGFWGKDQYRYLDITRQAVNWGRSYFLLLPFVLAGAYASLRERGRRPLAIALLIAFAAAAFLAVGVRTDVGRAVTLWLAAHLPAYAGMRETQKWVAVEVIAFGAFLAWGAARAFSTDIVKRNRAVSLAALAVICVMQAPTMIGGMGGVVRAAPYPPDWQAADALIAAGGCHGNTLFLPWHLYMGFAWSHAVSVETADRFFTCPVLASSDPEWRGAVDAEAAAHADIAAMIAGKGSGADAAFAAHDVRFVLLAKEEDWKDYSWLDALSQAHKIMDGDTLVLYEVRK